MSNIEQARKNMLEGQLRAGKVLNDTILDIIADTPREKYVPTDYQDVAFADKRIPLSASQSMLLPQEEGLILQAVAPRDNERVLEIGTGSGYLTALLAHMAKHVYSLEINPELSQRAADTLKQQGVFNVTVSNEDGCQGWQDKAPYDVIVINGALEQLPQALKKQLNIGGRLFVVLGKSPCMQAMLIERTAEELWQQTTLFDTDMQPLVNARCERFTF